MLRHRVLPVLLISQNQLVKTKKFKKPVYIGDPINAVKIFNDKEVDELVLLDITASKIGARPNFSLVEKIASECFMPFTYGGGIQSLDDARRLFSLGVEKISLQSAVFDHPGLVTEIASQFGQQSIVFSLDVVKALSGSLRPLHSAKSRIIKTELADLVTSAQSLGVGEILVTAVHREGTFGGPDLDLIRSISASANVPIVAVGGVRSLDDIRRVVEAGANAVGAGSFFVFAGPHRAVLLTYPKYSALEEALGNLDPKGPGDGRY